MPSVTELMPVKPQDATVAIKTIATRARTDAATLQEFAGDYAQELTKVCDQASWNAFCGNVAKTTAIIAGTSARNAYTAVMAHRLGYVAMYSEIEAAKLTDAAAIMRTLRKAFDPQGNDATFTLYASSLMLDVVWDRARRLGARGWKATAVAYRATVGKNLCDAAEFAVKLDKVLDAKPANIQTAISGLASSIVKDAAEKNKATAPVVPVIKRGLAELLADMRHDAAKAMMLAYRSYRIAEQCEEYAKTHTESPSEADKNIWAQVANDEFVVKWPETAVQASEVIAPNAVAPAAPAPAPAAPAK